MPRCAFFYVSIFCLMFSFSSKCIFFFSSDFCSRLVLYRRYSLMYIHFLHTHTHTHTYSTMI
uniref:Uncharacterized protein n=1 Tax=Anguilla anguilla TaxID=7936 RepID=A0A0E9SBG6_ANGAN